MTGIFIDKIKVELEDITKLQINRLREEYEKETGETISLGRLFDIGIASIIYIQAQHYEINENVSLNDLEKEYVEMLLQYKQKIANRITKSRWKPYDL